MSETIIFIKRYKSFVLGKCNCKCFIDIPIRAKRGHIQKYKNGHSPGINIIKFYKGRNHSKYKGGITRKGDYKVILRPHHKFGFKDGYVLLHRYLKELDIGRYLTKEEEVHHLDGNKKNNDPLNLQILTKAQHTSISRTKGNIKVKDRYCNSCKGKTLIDKKGWEYWHYINETYLCDRCYKKYKRSVATI